MFLLDHGTTTAIALRRVSPSPGSGGKQSDLGMSNSCMFPNFCWESNQLKSIGQEDDSTFARLRIHTNQVSGEISAD